VAYGAVYLSGVDFSGNYVIVNFISGAGVSIVNFSEIVDNSSIIDFPISAIGNGDTMNFSITYFTS
jgi:hypothetical protein